LLFGRLFLLALIVNNWFAGGVLPPQAGFSSDNCVRIHTYRIFFFPSWTPLIPLFGKLVR